MRTYTRYGVLPNGESFGVARTPTQENSYARDTVIVSEDGEIRACGWAFPDGGIGDHYPEPEVMLASPSAKTIVWLGGGELWVWGQDEELQSFISGFTKRVRIPNGAAVLDACMSESGMLDLWCEGGAHHVYSCDADILVCGHHASDLFWSAEGGTIVPLTQEAEAHPDGVRGYIESCLYAFPEVDGFLVGGDVAIEGWDLCSLPIYELRFAPEVECIGEGEFAVLGDLWTCFALETPVLDMRSMHNTIGTIGSSLYDIPLVDCTQDKAPRGTRAKGHHHDYHLPDQLPLGFLHQRSAV